MVAVWWLLFTLPCLLWVRERKPRATARRCARPRGPAGASCARRSREMRKLPAAVWFLLAYWLYIDGVNTIIKMAVDYGLSLGFPQQSLIAALLITQFVGFPAALAFGWLGERIGARNGIFIAIAVYAAATVAAYWMQRGRALLPARRRDRPGAGRHPVAVALVLRVAGARGQAGRVLRLLQHDGQVRRGARADHGRASRRSSTGDTRIGMLSIIVLFVGGAILLARSRAHAQECTSAASPDAAAIRTRRNAFNEAIAAEDIDAISNVLADDVILVTGTDSDVFTGREAQLATWREDFADARRAVYVRTPECISVFSVTPIALNTGAGAASAKARGRISPLAAMQRNGGGPTARGDWKRRSTRPRPAPGISVLSWRLRTDQAPFCSSSGRHFRLRREIAERRPVGSFQDGLPTAPRLRRGGR